MPIILGARNDKAGPVHLASQHRWRREINVLGVCCYTIGNATQQMDQLCYAGWLARKMGMKMGDARACDGPREIPRLTEGYEPCLLMTMRQAAEHPTIASGVTQQQR